MSIVALFVVQKTILTQAAPGINKTINFQGKMTDDQGLNVTDGNYQFVFRLYTVGSGGSATWTESVSLDVADGIFQHNLGSSAALPGSVDFDSDNIFLGITFNSDPDGEMSPRIQLTASPYAFNSDQLDGLDASDFVQLSPSVAQSGDIDITGSVTAGGLAIDGSSLFVDAATDRVGIGTLTPSAKLEVVGNIQATGGNVLVNSGQYFGANASYNVHFSGGYTNINGVNDVGLNVDTTNNGTGNFTVYKGATNSTGTGLFTVTNSGNVGIGDLSPAALLTVGDGDLFQVDGSGNVAASGTIEVAGQLTVGIADTTGVLLVLDTKTDTGDPAGQNGGMYYNSNTAKFRCYEGGAWVNCVASTAGNILNGGNTTGATVTIGTNDAQSLVLETSGAPRLTIGSTGTATFGGLVYAGDGAGWGYGLNGSGSLGFSAWGRAGANTASFGSSVSGDTNWRYIVNADGRITWGSGSVAGDTSLYRSGVSTLRTDSVLHSVRANASDFILNGWVSGDTSSRYNVSAAGVLSFGSGTASADTNLYRSAANMLRTNDSFTIDGALVVQGATQLNNGLTVAGSSDKTQLLVQAHSTQTNPLILAQDSNGDEIFRLHGEIDTVNSAGSLALGYQALQSNVFDFDNTTGINNTAVGHYALRDNTTGSSNSAFGNGSLMSSTTGVNNTAVGSMSLYSNTAGDMNTAVGLNALALNTTGGLNTAVGMQALVSNVDGQQNTAIGTLAGYNLTSGSNNLAIGYGTTFGSATGSYQLNIAGILSSSNYLSGNLEVGASNTVGQLLVLDTKTNTGDPTGVNGGMYYNSNAGKFRCYENTAWKDCISAGGGSLFTDGGSQTYLTSTGDELVVGGSSSYGAKMAIIGDSNQETLLLRTAASQTGANPVIKVEDSTGAELFRIHAGGVSSISIGNMAGYNDGGNTSSVAIGQQALLANVTGTNNLALGYFSLQQNTASNNTAIGANSLRRTETGHSNTAIGQNAGSYNISGSQNAYFGRAAGAGSSGNTGSASQNTSIGVGSGYDLDTGNGNVFIGYQTGEEVTTGSYNIAIGYGIDPASNTADYQLNIGGLLTSTNYTTDGLTVNGTIAVGSFGTASGNHLCYDGSNRIATCTSSRTQKHNIAASHYGLEAIRQLQSVSFAWNEDGRNDIGFIAEDVAEIIPETAQFNSDGSILSFSYDPVVSVLTQAVQQLDVQVQTDTVRLTVAEDNIAVLSAGLGGYANAASVQSMVNNLSSRIDVLEQGNFANLTVNGSANIAGNLTVSGVINAQTIKLAGKLVTAGAQPTGSVLGASVTGKTVTLSGNDTAGEFTLMLDNTASAAAGEQMLVQFASPFTSKPRVNLTALSEAAADIRYYVEPVATGFKIIFRDAPILGASYSFNYFVVQ